MMFKDLSLRRLALPLNCQAGTMRTTIWIKSLSFSFSWTMDNLTSVSQLTASTSMRTYLLLRNLYNVTSPQLTPFLSWKGNGTGTIHVDKGAFLKHIDMFDNVEFGISSRDARGLAPATKKLLETSFLALLDSGIDYRSRNIGCYTSATSFDITNVSEPVSCSPSHCITLSTCPNIRKQDEFEARGSFAGYPSMVSNRISIHLDLLGPSVPTDTACSSSLTSLHLAVQAIANGDCEAAVVGACQLNHRYVSRFSDSNYL